MTKLEILENLLGQDEALNLVNHGTVGSLLVVSINGHKYTYKPDSEKYSGSVEDLSNDFDKRIKVAGPGKALAWLKSVTVLASGSVKGISPLVRGIPTVS